MDDKDKLARKDWEEVENTPEFRTLIDSKKRFIIPTALFFVVYYFALPVLVGYAPKFMETRVIGPINLAYLFALSQFFMAWIIAALYVRRAGALDVLARKIREKLEK